MNRSSRLILWPFASLAVLAAFSHAVPPPARVEPVTETVHGFTFTDNYRWLEGDNSNPEQMGKPTKETAAWTDAQDAYTRSVLDNLPGRAELEAKLRPLMEVGSVSAPTMRGDYYFYTKREGKENQPRVLVREFHDGTPRVLLDPAALDATGLTTISGVWPSQDGKLLAFGTYRAGNEETIINVIETDSGTWRADQIPGKAALVQWMPDSSGFFYQRLENVADPYSAQVKYHKLGTHERMDSVLFRQYTKEENEKLATTWGPDATIDKNGRWMVLTYWTGTASNDAWAVDLNKWREMGKIEKVDIKVGANAIFGGEILGDTFYMVTDYQSPNKRVVKVNLNHPGEENWKEFVPERKDAVLSGFGLAKGIITLDYDKDATTQLSLVDYSGKSLGDLKLPGIGSAGLSVEDDRTEAYLSFTSFNYPPTIFRLNLTNPTVEPSVWERPDVPVDPSTVEVKQVRYTSKDGTSVPMFIIHKKGLVLDGNNPTVLNGYGGFNIAMTPSFSATLFPWFEAGGVFAVANLRGGSEYGKTWHEGGMLGNKQNVFDDMIAAADYLIKNKYTQPSRLAAQGGSNGGLLMGAMMTQRPDLFGAIVCQVPLLDMVRFQHFLMARYWVGEYGDAEADAAAMGWIKEYSPYQNIKSGVKYPGILFTAGDNDTRVHPLHARKMAAAMQATVANDPTARPVLLWVDREAGHGQGKPLNLRIRDAADIRLFIEWQLGMLPLKPDQVPTAKTSDKAAAGSSVKIQTVALHIEGMTCEMCVGKVQNALLAVPGVGRVTVDLKGKSSVVSAKGGEVVATSALIAGVEAAGFKASLATK
jgi:prolyl oligopeptidase